VKLRREKLVWIAIAIALMVVGCGPAATESAPAPVPPTQPPAPTATTELAFPTGVFTKANMTWEFKADGTYYWKEGKSGTDASGVYTVTGDQVVIKDDLFGCQDVAATYIWAYDGQKLSLRVVDDQCRDRNLVFDQTKWTKKP